HVRLLKANDGPTWTSAADLAVCPTSAHFYGELMTQDTKSVSCYRTRREHAECRSCCRWYSGSSCCPHGRGPRATLRLSAARHYVRVRRGPGTATIGGGTGHIYGTPSTRSCRRRSGCGPRD